MSKMRHDLRGPLINMFGFTNEMSNGLADVRKLLKNNKGDLPEHLVSQLDELLLEDVESCLGYIKNACDQLEERIEKYTSEPDCKP